MKFFRQLGLLLKQNLLERQRHPFMSLLEILWPLAVLAVFVLIRKNITAPWVPDCNYESRLLPSAGTMAFIQSLMCSASGRHCSTSSTDTRKRSLPISSSNSSRSRSSSSQVTTILSSFEQLVTANFETVQELPTLLPRSVSVIKELGARISDSQNIKEFLAINLTLRSFLKDPDAFGLLSRSAGIPANISDALLSSTVDPTNLDKLFSFGGDTRTMICNLGRYLLLPPKSSSVQLSQTLCSLDDVQASTFSSALQEQVSFVAILDTASGLALAFDEPVIAKELKSISTALEKSSDAESARLLQALYNQLPKFYKIFSNVQALIGNTNDNRTVALSTMAGIADGIFGSLNGILSNNSVWNQFFDIWSFGKTMLSIFTGSGTTSANEATLPFSYVFSGISTIPDLLRQFYNVSPSFTEDLNRSEVILSKVVKFQSLLLTSNASADSCKIAVTFWDMFVLPLSSATTEAQLQLPLDDIIETACSKQDATFYFAIQNGLNLPHLLNETGAMNRSKGSKAVVEEATVLFDSVKVFYNRYQSVIQAVLSLNYETLWQITHLVLAGGSLQQSNWFSLTKQVADIAQQALSSAGYENAVQSWLRFIDMHSDAILTMLKSSEGAITFLSTELQRGGHLNELWTSVAQLNVSDSVVTFAKILDAVADGYLAALRNGNGDLLSNDSMVLCHSLVNILSSEIRQDLLDTVHRVVCQQNTSVIQAAVRQAFSLKSVEDSFAALLRVYNNSAGLGDLQVNSTLNAGGVLTKFSTIVNTALQLQLRLNGKNVSMSPSIASSQEVDRSLLLYTLLRQAGAACHALLQVLYMSPNEQNICSSFVSKARSAFGNVTNASRDLGSADTWSSIVTILSRTALGAINPYTNMPLEDLQRLILDLAEHKAVDLESLLSLVSLIESAASKAVGNSPYWKQYQQWLAIGGYFVDAVNGSVQYVEETFGYYSTIARFWLLLPEEQKYNALLVQVSLSLGSDVPTTQSTMLCNLTGTLNYTNTESQRDALRALFCQKNISAFASAITSVLNASAILDRVYAAISAYYTWPPSNTTTSLGFSLAQLAKKARYAAEAIPVLVDYAEAYWTQLQQIAGKLDWQEVPGVLAKLGYTLYQWMTNTVNWNSSVGTTILSPSRNDGTYQAQIMRRSASISIPNALDLIRNLFSKTTFAEKYTLLYYDQIQSLVNGSQQFNISSLRDSCSELLAGVRLMDLMAQPEVVASLTSVHSTLLTLAKAASTSAELTTMTCHLLQADFAKLMASIKSFNLTQAGMLVTGQQSAQATTTISMTTEVCDVVVTPLTDVATALNQMATASKGCSLTNGIPPLLESNSSLLYLRSITEASRQLNLIVLPIFANNSADQLNFLVLLLQAAIEYSIQPSSRAILSYVLTTNQNFTTSLSLTGYPADEIAKVLGSTVNIDSMILLSGYRPGLVDHAVCTSAEALHNLFVSAEFNMTLLYGALCHQVGPATFSSLVSSLNYTQMERLIAKKPLSTLLLDLSTATKPFIELNSWADVTELAAFATDFGAVARLVQRIALPSASKNISNLARLAIKFTDDFERVSPYFQNASFRDLSTVLQGASRALGNFVDLQEQLKISVQLKDLFINYTAVLGSLVGEEKFTPALARAILEQYLDISVLLSTVNLSVIDELVCSPSGLPDLLRQSSWLTNVTMDGVRHLLCELNPSLAAEMSASLQQKLLPQSLISQIVRMTPERFLGSSSSRLLNDARSLLPLQQFFTKSSAVLSAANSAISLPLEALGALQANTGEVFVYPNQLASLSSAFCGEQLDTNSLSAIASPYARRKRSFDDDYQEFMALPSEVCQALMLLIREKPYGTVIWAFIKPLLAGKILFTPQNNFTEAVMQKANRTFIEALQIVEFFRLLRAGIQNSSLTDHNTLQSAIAALNQEALKDPLIQKLLSQTFSFDLSSIDQALGMFSQGSNSTNVLLSLSSIIVQAAACISFSRFEGVPSEEELVSRAQAMGKNRTFLAGVVFLNGANEYDIRYKIRMNRDQVPSTLSTREAVYTSNPLDNYLSNLKYLQGFTQLQDMIEQAIIDVLSGPEGSAGRRPAQRLRQMPAPCYQNDVFKGVWYPYILLLIVGLGWLLSVAHSIKTLVYYKDTGLDEALKLVSVQSRTVWIAWLINNLIVMLLVSGITSVIVIYLNVLKYSDPVIIFLYFATFSLSTLSLCFLISSFFTKANLAATLGVMIYLLSMLPFAASISWSGIISHEQQTAICILSSTAFAIGAEQIMRWEQLNSGVQWSNMASIPGFDNRSVTVLWAFIWMLVDTAIYFILGYYFSNVLPSKYGSPRPWYFLLSPSFWRPAACTRKRNALKSYTLPALAEEEFYSYVVGISMQSLSKKFKNKSAVCDLSLDFYEEQVTAFLGKNGAGKTTTIHMLTGVRTPSSGSAYINGLDIATDMEMIRSKLGFCPQFDMLFDYMTVKEHLTYFAELKGDRHGLSAKMLLHDIGLEQVANEQVANISGGLRRRLSVALAFCGNSKTIILDEPTSSVDPNGRRAIWDVILKYRPGRTIVLCTHHLDEAELIADRVAIMKEGKLLCTGSPLALKRQYSRGHELLIEMKPCLAGTASDDSIISSAAAAASVTDFVKSHIPSAEMDRSNASTLAYKLPLDDRHRFGQLCIALDGELDRLGISCYTITDCSLEEVFLTVTKDSTTALPSGTDVQCGNASRDSDCTESSTVAVAAATGGEDAAGTTTPSSRQSAVVLTPELTSSHGTAAVTGCHKFLQQLRALFKKRLYHNSRNWKAYMTLVLLPCLFVGLAVMVAAITPDESNWPELVLQQSLYPGSYIFFKDNTSQKLLSDSLLKGSWMNTPCLQYRQSINSTTTCSPLYTARRSTCAIPADPLPSCSCSGGDQCTDLMPAVDEWSAGSDVLQRVCDAYNVDDYLYSTSLLDQYKSKRLGGWTLSDPDATSTNASGPVGTTWFDNRAFHALPVLLNGLNNAVLRSRSQRLINASITVSNHPITLTSASINISTVLRAIADSGLALFLLVALSFVPAGLLRYTMGEHLRGEKRQQALCGLNMGLYWLTTFVWDILVFALTIGLTIVILLAFDVKGYVARDNAVAVTLLLILYAWAALPCSYMFLRAFKDTITAFFTTLLFSMFIGSLLTTAFLFLQFLPADVLSPDTVAIAANACLSVPQFALTSGLVKLTVNELQADVFESFGKSSYKNPLYLLRDDYVALALEGLVFLGITALVEWCHVRKCYRSLSISHKTDALTADEEDVAAERTRALGCDPKEQAVVLHDVSKQYLELGRTITAVDSVSFAVAPGECFGMLGVNGAGKTTTFGMMTGTIGVSRGDIYILGHRITLAGSRGHPVVGYCPQENALDGKLTGREMLQFYGSLRGIAPDELEREIGRLITAFCMESFVERRTGRYSGGMKRTLSVALAMLGRPSLVFLDEPTAGMDPHARQIVWQHVRNYVSAGGSIVLTSHSMNECDQLCDRLAIMVNGRFACIGSPQHLKNRYADGHTIKMKLKGTKINQRDIISFMEQHFTGPKLIDRHASSLEFFLPTSAAKLGELYSTIERARLRLEITDYAIFQTTLDQVFIRFARDQAAQPSSRDGETNEAVEEA